MTTIPVPDTRPDAASAPSARAGGIGRAVLRGAAIGFVVAVAAIAVLGAVRDVHPASTLALGAYVGAVSGVGFGAMVGAVLELARLEAEEAGDG